MPTTEAAPPVLALHVKEAARVAGISRAKLYELIDAGELKSLKIGRRRLILSADLQSMLQAHAA